MAKSKKKTDSVDLFAVPKSAQEIKMENAQDLYNYLFEACNIIRGPVCMGSLECSPSDKQVVRTS